MYSSFVRAIKYLFTVVGKIIYPILYLIIEKTLRQECVKGFFGKPILYSADIGKNMNR